MTFWFHARRPLQAMRFSGLSMRLERRKSHDVSDLFSGLKAGFARLTCQPLLLFRDLILSLSKGRCARRRS